MSPNPAVPIVEPRIADDSTVAAALGERLSSVCGRTSPAMVSDNIAYDFTWIAGMFDRADMDNRSAELSTMSAPVSA